MFLVVAMCHRSADSQAGSVSYHQACCVSRHHVKSAELSIRIWTVVEVTAPSFVSRCSLGSTPSFLFSPQGGSCNSWDERLRQLLRVSVVLATDEGIASIGRRLTEVTSEGRFGGKVPCRVCFYGNLRKAVTRSSSFLRT